MDETKNPGNSGKPSSPLAENPYVQELFDIMNDNARDSAGLIALLNHVSEMESFIKRAEDKIADMKSQLAEMKEIQNHPVKKSLQQAINVLANRVALVKLHLSELKSSIIESCKSAVQAFKEKGTVALDNLAQFFCVKSDLKDWNQDLDEIIKNDDKAIAKIEAFASEYHSVGRALKNMGRVFLGKEPTDVKKETGNIANAMTAPYKAQKAIVTNIKKLAEKTIVKLDSLEASASELRDNKQEKVLRTRESKEPSLLDELLNTKQLVEQRKRDAPIQERGKETAVEV